MEGDVPQVLEPPIQPLDAGTVSTVCGTASGTRFNLEPRTNAQAQHTPSVDFLRNRVAAGVDLVVGAATDARDLHGNRTWYYVSRDADCAPEFEGALPVLDTSEGPLVGQGSVVVAADSVRDAVFMADVRQGNGGEDLRGIALFRTTGATLMNPGLCPNGTHTESQASTCWPTSRLIVVVSLGDVVLDPSIAVDERPSGTGAGHVYVAATIYLGSYTIGLEACTNDLASCSSTRLFPRIPV